MARNQIFNSNKNYKCLSKVLDKKKYSQNYRKIVIKFQMKM